MKLCYNTDFTLPKQSQRSRPVLQDGSRSWDCFGREKTPSYNRRNTVTYGNIKVHSYFSMFFCHFYEDSHKNTKNVSLCKNGKRKKTKKTKLNSYAIHQKFFRSDKWHEDPVLCRVHCKCVHNLPRIKLIHDKLFPDRDYLFISVVFVVLR